MPEGRVELVSGAAEQVVGHLGGWGGYEKSASLALARTSGDPVRRLVSWIARGRGEVVLTAGSTRTGRVEARVEVG
jgi:hypothetical protein